jgi:hypothetical protein
VPLKPVHVRVNATDVSAHQISLLPHEDTVFTPTRRLADRPSRAPIAHCLAEEGLVKPDTEFRRAVTALKGSNFAGLNIGIVPKLQDFLRGRRADCYSSL